MGTGSVHSALTLHETLQLRFESTMSKVRGGTLNRLLAFASHDFHKGNGEV